MSTIAHQLNAELGALVETAQRGLVEIRNGHRGAGAGTIWHPDGLIVTNAHVASEGRPQVVFPNRTSHPARILAYDPERDLAALMVDATGLPTIEVGSSRDLRPGQWVLAVGHPWGILRAATAGIVIGVGSGLPEMPGSQQEWVVASLRLRPGHSGGPLIDVHGRLVGINTMIAGPNIGLAVPAHVVKAFLRESVGTFGVAA